MILQALTKSAKETQILAGIFAKELRKLKKKKGAKVISLDGALGTGKTTFIQGFARGLGVRRKILSPSFLIMRPYSLSRGKTLWHLDCYRLKSDKELWGLGLEEILQDQNNIVLIEWGKKVSRLLPKNTIEIHFTYGPVKDWRVILLGVK